MLACCSPIDWREQEVVHSEEFVQSAAGALMLRQIAQQAEIGKVKTWPHAAAHQAPGSGAASRLPPVRFHDSHRGQPVFRWAKTLTLNLSACRRQGQQLKGIPSCEVPGFIGCDDAVPAADFAGMEQKQDGRQSRTRLAVAAANCLGAAVDLAIPAALWMGL